MRIPTSTNGTGEDSGAANVIDSAIPSETTAQFVVVSSRVRQCVDR